MPWTDVARINEWVSSVDLIAEPTALSQSLSDAQDDVYGRLITFIAKATVDAWTTTANTPDRVQYWTARVAAAIYLSKYQGYHLRPEIPDNPAAVIYDAVIKEIDEAKYGTIVIVNQAGAVVAVAGVPVSAPTRYADYLPVSQGGEIPD